MVLLANVWMFRVFEVVQSVEKTAQSQEQRLILMGYVYASSSQKFQVRSVVLGLLHTYGERQSLP